LTGVASRQDERGRSRRPAGLDEEYLVEERIERSELMLQQSTGAERQQRFRAAHPSRRAPGEERHWDLNLHSGRDASIGETSYQLSVIRFQFQGGQRRHARTDN
jgi:hypothetical protein